MSLKTPVRLPSTLAEPVDKVTCRICRRQFSKYTCPTCNIAYCSLVCFRSESHAQCSETFYRKEVESDIRSEPSKTAQERLKMMELLKRFEEESMNEDHNTFDDEESEADDGADLVKRLQHVNLESTSSEALWSILTLDERTKFLKALENPESELAQQLLASEELERNSQQPWWESPALDSDGQTKPSSIKKFGLKPELMLIPANMVKTISSGSPLVYNMSAIFIAYAYATRCLSISPLSSIRPGNPDYQETRRLISQLVPFLTNRKATTLYPNLPSVITDTWSRFDPGKMKSSFFSVLLRDTANIIRPLPIALISSSVPSNVSSSSSLHYDHSSHPNRTAILAFSDLSELFGASIWKQPIQSLNPTQNHITHKLLFYAAHTLSTPSVVFQAMAEELVVRSQAVEEEATFVGSFEQVPQMPIRTRDADGKAGIIEEL